MTDIRVGMSAERLEAFMLQCGNVLEPTQPDGEHEQLLYEHLAELHHELCKMYEREQNTYRIRLSGSQALAFYQLFQRVNINHCPYSMVVINDTIAQIDKQSHSPKKKYRNVTNRRN